jgi:aspartate kinase
VHGVHASLTAAKITVTGMPDHAAATAAVFRIIAEQDVIPGMVSQNPTGAPTGRTAIAFTVARSAGPVVLGALRTARARIGFDRVDLEDGVAVITLTGAGLRADPVVPATFCEVLAREGVRMEIVSFESGQISVTCGRHELETAVRALREVFELAVQAHSTCGRTGGSVGARVERARRDE